jgi:hypothetical protein
MFPIVAIALLALFQLGATWWVWHSNVYERSEKLAQTKLVWLIPGLGAAVVVAMLIHESKG